VPTKSGKVDDEFVVNPTIVICEILVAPGFPMKRPTLIDAGPKGLPGAPMIPELPSRKSKYLSGTVFGL